MSDFHENSLVNENNTNAVSESEANAEVDIELDLQEHAEVSVEENGEVIAVADTDENAEAGDELSPLPTPPFPVNRQQLARRRWEPLINVLSSESVASYFEGVVAAQTRIERRFRSFDILRQKIFDDYVTLNCLGDPDNWYKYYIRIEGGDEPEYCLNIYHQEHALYENDFFDVNMTGNVYLWPSEEALLAYALGNIKEYRNKWILELGGGYTCLTGLMLAKYAKPYAVCLTDGNEACVKAVKKTVCINELDCFVKSLVLKWEDVEARQGSEAGKFDIILAADCICFDDSRAALIDTIWYYLSPNGFAVVMAPQRGNSIEMFVEECHVKGFITMVVHRYNDAIWERHLELKNSPIYDENKHYPVLMRLIKSDSGLTRKRILDTARTKII